MREPFVKLFPVCAAVFLFKIVSTYYQNYRCFGTGDCIISAGYMGGGFTDAYDRWLIECADGEAAIVDFDPNSLPGNSREGIVMYGRCLVLSYTTLFKPRPVVQFLQLFWSFIFLKPLIICERNLGEHSFSCLPIRGGIYDGYKKFSGISQVWCYFAFPLKPPGKGFYPYYPHCNVRNITIHEYYCYDKYYPVDTVDTFVTGYYSPTNYDPAEPSLQKCCRTPPGYRIDYNRCQWKYTHDRMGEHYDGYWLVKCDTNFIMTGTGQARNPYDNQTHWVWIQCCPTVYLGYPGYAALARPNPYSYVPSRRASLSYG
ncbi:uncharacterized protein LOC129591161 [Paramacrobiotus metropolitanus]|uniref:uncharacterized protein LOC129591161 n=1 Tax=Paramacrobiotus metropolitanus TaxID=2943436 RepID=UPI0024460ABC|nr:uncharacterized protein LOC129591161 [Paramacrobiotus metropolitanus]